MFRESRQLVTNLLLTCCSLVNNTANYSLLTWQDSLLCRLQVRNKSATSPLAYHRWHTIPSTHVTIDFIFETSKSTAFEIFL